MCWDYLKWAKDVCFDPEKNTKKNYKYGEFIKRLATISLVSGVAMTAITLLAFVDDLKSMDGIAWASAFVFIPVYLISAAISPFINGAIYHFFGKLVFRLMKSDYKKTYNAAAYSDVPGLLFGWIPVVGGLLSLIWGIIVAIFAFSNQQKISKKRALLVIFIPIIIVISIALVVVFAVGGWSRSFMSTMGYELDKQITGY
jgi:hypothetical protein